MADWVQDVKPHRVFLSHDPNPATGHTRISRAEALVIDAIPPHYRTGTSPNIVEMDAAAKAAVDAARQTAADDEQMNERRAFVYALKKQVRRELNVIRAEVGLPNLTPAGFSSSIRARLEES